MIGDKRLEMPETNEGCFDLLESYGFNLANGLSDNAERLVKLNNEIYDKLQSEAQKIHDICYYNRNEDGAWTHSCRKDKSN